MPLNYADLWKAGNCLEIQTYLFSGWFEKIKCHPRLQEMTSYIFYNVKGSEVDMLGRWCIYHNQHGENNLPKYLPVWTWNELYTCLIRKCFKSLFSYSIKEKKALDYELIKFLHLFDKKASLAWLNLTAQMNFSLSDIYCFSLTQNNFSKNNFPMRTEICSSKKQIFLEQKHFETKCENRIKLSLSIIAMRCPAFSLK